MDRDWLTADRRSKEFQNGVEELLLFAFENGFDENKISCPCVKCTHSKSWKARIVKDHLFLNGIDETYKCWIWHGESAGGSQSSEKTGSSQSVHQIPMETENVDGDIASDLFDGKDVSHEIRWIADGPNKDVPAFSGYKIDGVTYSTKDRDDTRQVQCIGVCVQADTMVVDGKDQNIEHMSHIFYGVIVDIWELDYSNFRIPLFRCKWVDMNKGIKVDDLGYTLVNLNRLGYLNDPFVLAKHVRQVCYIDDSLDKLWSIVLKLPDKKYYEDNEDESEGSVEVELENDFFLPNLPDVDEEDVASYIRDDIDELIELS
ncbi:hypothetical protein POM88_054085 [Heracleum sosnowskyi]|uniref:Transposase-associated domain-containing protein n=1 Tax=Heracleum sosnowskyi TaxID=360622 RepID=A0AAD8GPA0_9APIA|nr:hypothetical protein POM88_054085 [Heracleum sosnowskyi]